VPTDTFQSLVVSLVLTRLDFGNSVLAGLPVYLVCRLQSVLNAAARLTYHLRRSDHITDALVCPHWLRVPERVQFKISQDLSCTDSRHNTLVRSTLLPTCLAVDLFILPTPTVLWCRRSGCQLLPTELSRWSALKSGMTYRLKWHPVNRWPHSASDWKLTFFQNHFPVISWTLTNFPGH